MRPLVRTTELLPLSKVLESVITEISVIFCSNSLQFGFKSGYSTTLCTGMIKNIVSQYIHNGSVVYMVAFLMLVKPFI